MKYEHLRRVFDVLFGGIAMVLLAPVIALVALTVRLFIGSPILFRQPRAGIHGEPFVLVKFRTMIDTADSLASNVENGKSLSRFGLALRSTSLDELPELWNVFRGDMSLIGPRPLPTRYSPRYSPQQAKRLEVRPGLTGWAQVNGRNSVSWEGRFELDVWYVNNRSLTLDLQILGKTIKTVVHRKHTHDSDNKTMPEFQGTDPQILNAGPIP